MTTTRTYGTKFQTIDRHASAADIAKRMRSDIKDAIAAGRLPGRVSNYSVRVDNFSMGRSIDIEARDFDGMWIDGTDRWGQPARILSLPGQKIKATLERIHRGYNYDGSDVMTDYFDVNFYGDVRIEDESSRAYRIQEAEKAKARRAAPKTPKIDRKALAAHLRDHHHFGGTDRANADVLATWHRLAHEQKMGQNWKSAARHTDHDLDTYVR